MLRLFRDRCQYAEKTRISPEIIEGGGLTPSGAATEKNFTEDEEALFFPLKHAPSVCPHNSGTPCLRCNAKILV